MKNDASFNKLKARLEWHQQEVNNLTMAIMQLNEKIDEAIAARERHNGAIKELQHIANAIAETAGGNPVTDPLADSDQ
jgi:uncharacterized protein YlxW (UPF0749 family)